MAKSGYLTASEAASELRISLATLYSYVSRGLIRSEATGPTKRERRYSWEDVQKLKGRKEQRRDPAVAVQQALHWGAPVLESALTLIEDGKIYYRGYDVLTLAKKHSIEQVASLLWCGNLNIDLNSLFSRGASLDLNRYQHMLPQKQEISLIEAFQMVLPLAACEDPMAYDLRPGAVAHTGARILSLLTLVASQRDSELPAKEEPRIAEILQQSWAPGNPDTRNLIDAALVLCADHELNVSSFTARCVASANSSPYAVISAGLAALQGTKHGGHVERVEALFQEIGTSTNAGRVLASRLKRGEDIPGFGHRLYPEGDPRSQLLLQLIENTFPSNPAVALANATIEEAAHIIGEHPTIDFGLVVLALALNLPPGGALAVFALSRSVGWIAHAIEQYQMDQLIRPRARYTGPQPNS